MITPTQRHIAAKAEVSRSTVSAVLSSSPIHISSAVRQRVLDVAASLNYRPNRYAQITRNGRSGIIGILGFGHIGHLSQQRVLTSAEAILEENYEPFVQEAPWFSQDGDNKREAACNRMIDARVEGLVLLNPDSSFKQALLDKVLKAGIPTVAMGGEHLCDIPRFVSDRRWGYEQIARHLLNLGRRRMAVLSKESSFHFIERGVSRAIREEGGEITEIHHPVLASSPEPPAYLADQMLGRQGMAHILSAGSSPDAVICSNDNWAQGALTACAEADLAVPGEIALTGFDDAPSSGFGTVPLTTISHPLEEISARTIECLVDMIRSGKEPETRLTKIRGRLVVRRSCGAFQKNLHPKVPPTL